MSSKVLWWWDKPLVRPIEKDFDEEPVLLVKDRFQDKLHIDNLATVRWLSWPSSRPLWHHDHSKGRNVKGVDFLTLMASGRVQGQRCAMPLNVHLTEENLRTPHTQGGSRKQGHLRFRCKDVW
jgi:hypothetical protein